MERRFAMAFRGANRNPEASGVGGHENSTVLEGDHGGEDPCHLVRAEDGGELLGLPGAADALHDPLALECDLVEEPECSDGLVVIAPGDVLLLNEVNEAGADLVGSEGLGRPAKVSCEGGDSLEVDLDCLGREVSEFHVLDHSTAKLSRDVI
jgi:hypothetical protein